MILPDIPPGIASGVSAEIAQAIPVWIFSGILTCILQDVPIGVSTKNSPGISPRVAQGVWIHIHYRSF